jgi:hypothetical protein
VARLAPAGQRRATLVLVAHLDAAHTGLMWRLIKDDAKGAARRRRRKALAPLAAPFGGALAFAALGSLLEVASDRAPRAKGAAGGRTFRVASAAALFANVAGLLDVARAPTVPGANDNATGVAALIELARRLATEPADGLEVVFVAPGGEESGMDGFRAFLATHDLPSDAFVLNLDSLGSGMPALLRAEGTLLPHGYADADNDVVDAGARRAGEGPLERWRLGGWTDAMLARFAGLRAACLISFGEHGRITRYHVVEDTPDGVDFACVERCVAIAEGTAREVAG